MNCRLLILATLFTSLFYPNCSGAEITQEELRKFTESAIRNKDVSIAPPKLDWSGPTVLVELGGVITGEQPEQKDFDPLDIPLECQFQVTVLRMYRNTPRQRRFWRPVLRDAEAIISNMLATINNASNNQTLIKDLRKQQVEMFQVINDRLGKLAKEQGKDGIASPAPWRQYTINIVTVPGGGVVRYMYSGDWALYKFRRRLGIQVEKPPWTTLAQNPAMLGGTYWFNVTWPDGTNRSIRTEVIKEGQLVLSSR